MSEGQKSNRLLRWLEAGNCTDFFGLSLTCLSNFNVPEAER